jgi:DNA repair protein RecN (Recombination protein N)
MLKSLLIENYALIEKLDISFDHGLTIITGETGAGKSILLGALNLILGNRADLTTLHNKEAKCIIEGAFFIKDLQLEPLFEANDIDFDEITILRREINNQGKSRAFVNDTPVNLNVMKQIAERVIDIHSQHQSLLFSNQGFRYNLIDSFAGIAAKTVFYKQQYLSLLNIRKELEKLLQSEKQTRAELDYFVFQHDELFKAALIPGEADEIAAELEILNNAGTIKYNLEKADYILQNAPDNVLHAVRELSALFKAIEKFHPSYGAILERLNSSFIEIKDISDEISAFKDDVADDPQRASNLQQRYDLLQKLMHKHNARNTEDLIDVRDDFALKIQGFESLEQQIKELTLICDEKETQLLELASEISHLRTQAIAPLEKEINVLLIELAMPKAQFRVYLGPKTEPGIHGTDEITFLFSANPGAPLLELDKVASGGEMSRLMLAVKSVISRKNLLPTIIFDEIDTGVSGEIGIKMGRILSDIALDMQVISVTHLPQVAALGKKHYVVYKNVDNDTTRTFVKEVRNDDRTLEIAKMLGGDNPGPALMKAALELLENRNINKKHI